MRDDLPNERCGDKQRLHGLLEEIEALPVVNGSVRAAGFKLKDLLPPELEASARAGKRTRGAGLRQLQGMGPTRFVLSVDDDNEMRSRCE